jgi:hypothetical protein
VVRRVRLAELSALDVGQRRAVQRPRRRMPVRRRVDDVARHQAHDAVHEPRIRRPDEQRTLAPTRDADHDDAAPIDVGLRPQTLQGVSEVLERDVLQLGRQPRQRPPWTRSRRTLKPDRAGTKKS